MTNKSKTVQLYQIYYQSILNILNYFPKANFGIRWHNHNEFVYDVEISNLNDVNILKDIIKNNSGTDIYTLKNENLNISEFIEKIDNTAQFKNKQLLQDYFIYDKYFTGKEDEQYYLEQVKQAIADYNDDYMNIYLLNYVQYSFFMFLKKRSDFIESINKNDVRNNFAIIDFEIYLTFVFINLSAIIKNLKVPVLKYLQGISIKKYNRFKSNKEIEVCSIADLINHFRDAACHKETENNKICQINKKGGKVIFFLSGVDNDFTIINGNGHLNVNKQLKPLIIKLKQFLVKKDLPAILIVDKKDKIVFCDLATGDEDFPLQGNFKVSLIGENLFRIHFPIIS